MSGQRHPFRVFCTAVLIYALFVLPCAYSSVPQNIGSPDIHQRQDLPSPFLAAPPDTTSFDYWWPYPPASTTDVPGETDTGASDAGTTSPSTTSENMSMSSSEFEFVASTISSQSDIGSASIITITALPPLTSPSRGAHAQVSAYRKPFNLILLIPILGIVSGAVGLACGWWGYDIWRKRWPRNSENDIAGPRYECVEGDASMFEEKDVNNLTHEIIDEDNDGDNDAGGLQSDRMSSSHRREGAEVLDQPSESKCPRIGLPALLHSPLLSGFAYGRVGSVSKPVCEEGSQRTQFLSADPYGKPGGKEGLPVEDLRSPFAPTVFSSVATSDEDDEDYDDARQTINQQYMIRNKSIRHRIVERLQLQFSPRRGTMRQKLEKQSKSRGRTPELEKGFLMQGEIEVSNTRLVRAGPTKPSENASGVSRHGRAISDFTIATDELQTPIRAYAPEDKRVDHGSTSCKTLRNARIYSSPLNDSTSVGDKFTPLPKRNSKLTRKLTSMQSSRQRMEALEDSDASFSPSLATIRRVLPASPPLVSSPRLEAELFFSSGAVPIASSQPAKVEMLDLCDIPPARRGPSGPRRANKLLSKHSPARMAEASPGSPIRSTQGRFKALPPSPPRRNAGRSSSNTPAKWTLQADVKSRPRSNTDPPVLMTPKARYEARRVALNKVDTIVSHGWSTRNLRGIPPPSSPTMFGARLEKEAENYLPSLGIEQALGRP